MIAIPKDWSLAKATETDREIVAGLRHEIYARELGQHAVNGAERLADALDDWNVVLVAKRGGEIGGFVSVTPPGQPSYSIDKYFGRDALPFTVDGRLHEIRLLTVMKPHRGRQLTLLLMYAALRWVEAHGGTRIVVLGRREIAGLYRRIGMKETGLCAQSGAVTYDLMVGAVAELRARADAMAGPLDRLAERTAWRLPFSFRPPAPCFHGGTFFASIGEKFDHLERSQTVINADVLDAWFPPAPGVLAALQRHLPWLLRTSPPTQCGGLIEVIAQARGVGPENILPGAGSSDLIFRAMRHWLSAPARALILDPTYGEYAHVLERVIGCQVDRLPLSWENDFDLDLPRFAEALGRGYDLVVVVNPNSPTGRHVSRGRLEEVLRLVPLQSRVWVDETYVEFAGPGESIEAMAAQSENVIVCKSMSKAYALSGARVAYLCAGPHQLEALRPITPPWVVGLPAQVAAVAALQDPEYYRARYRETAEQREAFAAELAGLDWTVTPGVANFVLARLPDAGPDAAALVRHCAAQGLHLRDAASMSARLGDRCVRIAVKDAATNRRMLSILRQVFFQPEFSGEMSLRE